MELLDVERLGLARQYIRDEHRIPGGPAMHHGAAKVMSGWSERAASISPSSIRRPRIFT
ncbi:hypothetical protein MLGJGCBP_01798 [Rhodococcus sp. T7]|uniref:hypothetical protein n=1 Tax=Rhodococcus opacus TaxID=37919 RepID=UPI000AAD7A85|nr:hypothetical protein [Rhodococcus opacus]KAF0957475.1 hypothetical protein MLGJGCBP_09307 [Rhodococcus sp. T7]KAF0965046.1 hypothetical protein MLGJGCBP_01798 [Rhodococcus sp. T7]